MNQSKAAYNKLKQLLERPGKVLCIHCSRQNLTDNEGGKSTPRITAIMVKSLDGRINKTFAIHHEAEKVKVEWDEVENWYDQLEERMIADFNKFVADFNEYQWLHWDMDGVHSGFEALEHRYCVLIDADKNGFNAVPIEKRIHLAALIKSIYGSDCEREPVFENLMKSNHNGGIKSGFLSLDAEARAFKDSDYPKILESVRCKVEFLTEIVDKTSNKRLKVSKRNILVKLGSFITHPLVATITAIATIIGVILTMVSMME